MVVGSESTTIPNWLDLPRDLTANILQRLGAFKILTSVCRVCPLWWNICHDPLMWRSIRMRGYGSPCTEFWDMSYDYYHKQEMVKICCNAIERSCNDLEDIDIEGFGNDDILNCIANNGSHLRSMRFADCYEISDEGFSEVARMLLLLEKLDISYTKLTVVSIAVLGRSCPLLKSLKFNFNGYGFDSKPCDDLALVIADTMSNLCHLDINGDCLTNVGLLSILDKCPFLESLDLQQCIYLDLSGSLEKRCIDQINHLQLPIRYDSDDFYDYDEDYRLYY